MDILAILLCPDIKEYPTPCPCKDLVVCELRSTPRSKSCGYKHFTWELILAPISREESSHSGEGKQPIKGYCCLYPTLEKKWRAWPSNFLTGEIWTKDSYTPAAIHWGIHWWKGLPGSMNTSGQKQQEEQKKAQPWGQSTDRSASMKVWGCERLWETPGGVGGHRQHIRKTKESWVSLNWLRLFLSVKWLQKWIWLTDKRK